MTRRTAQRYEGGYPAGDIDDDPSTPPVALCDITTPNGSSFPDGVSYPGDFVPFGTDNRFNFSEYNLILTPSERRGVFGQARYEVNDSTTWYVRTLFNNRQSTNQAAPEPIFLGPDAGTGNRYADDIFISGDNPYNPFGIDLISSGPDANLIMIGRRPVEGGARVFEQDIDTWHIGSLAGVDYRQGHRGMAEVFGGVLPGLERTEMSSQQVA